MGTHAGLRRAGAVFAGIVAIVILSNGTDAVLHATGIFPPWGQPMGDGLFLLAAAYRIAFSIAGCYLAARLAPDRPFRAALVLGVVGVVVSALGAAVTWNMAPAIGPRWYSLALVALALPCAWAGGRSDRQLRRRGSPANA